MTDLEALDIATRHILAIHTYRYMALRCLVDRAMPPAPTANLLFGRIRQTYWFILAGAGGMK